MKYLITVLSALTLSCVHPVGEREKKQNNLTLNEKLLTVEAEIGPSSQNMKFSFRRYYFDSKEVLFNTYSSNGSNSPIFISFSESDCDDIDINSRLFPDSLLPDMAVLSRISRTFCELDLVRFESDTIGNYFVSFTNRETLEYVYSLDTSMLASANKYTHFRRNWWEIH